jgi:alpha-glucuronidase
LDAARAELVRGFGGLFGTAVAVHTEVPGHLGHLLVGTAEDPELATLLARAGSPELGAGGFALVPSRLGPDSDRKGDAGRAGAEGESLALIGGTELGCLYGSFALLRRAAAGVPPPAWPVVEQPAAALRLVEHWDNLDGTVERGYAGRSIFFDRGEVTQDLARVYDYGRLLASVGINGIAVNNVNVDRAAMELLTPRHLGGLARVAGVLRPLGVRLVLSVGLASPIVLSGLPTADPQDPAVCRWWADAAARTYGYIPDLLGFLVKAGSEAQPGPHDYGRTHADGANALAQAVRPYGGCVMWRCFVYDGHQDWRDESKDRAKAAFAEFAPLDGAFADNVALQIKAGPMDFQVREPPAPLLAAMPSTSKLLEVQLTQEYTGQQIHLCYLVPSWKETLDFDIHANSEGPTVSELVRRRRDGPAAPSGMAGVANVGDEPNWTGHVLAQANLYGFGRLSWDPGLAPAEIATEWARLTFAADEKVVGTVVRMLMGSREAYESYTSPLGLGWMVTPRDHYGPAVDGYEYSRWGTYHRADSISVGVDRTSAHGTGFTDQYDEPWRSIFADPGRCPEDLLLFFHRLEYTHRLRSGKTLIQHIYDSHFDGVATVEQFLDSWRDLQDRVDVVRFKSVERSLVEQLRSAEEWRDVVNAYFHRKSGAPDDKGRPVY